MKKLITFLFILTLAYFSIQAQVTKVTIARETFGNLVFGVNEHGPQIAFEGYFYTNSARNFICGDDTTAVAFYDTLFCDGDTLIGIPGSPYDAPGYTRHFDYDFVQAVTDAGLGGFTITNGRTISLSSDSSIQMNTYVLGDNQPWDNPSGSVKLHMTPSGRYNGSWDSIAIIDVDISRFEGTLDSIGVEFGLGKRNHSPQTRYACGLNVSLSMDNGANWIDLDTTAFATDTNFVVDAWRYIEMPPYSGADVATASTIAVRFADVNYLNQLAIDDIQIVGWGEDLPTLTDIDVISLSGVNTIGTLDGTLAFGTDVTPKDVFDTTVTWSIGAASTGCASIDEDGVLTAEGNGTIVVTATANDGGGTIGTFNVNITNNPTDVTTITVTSVGATLEGGNTMQMTATVLPVCADDKTVTWSVNDEDFATVSATGLLTPVGTGSVQVTATANDGSDITGSKTILIHVTGIQNIENTEISIYPVPAQGILHLDNVSSIQSVEVLGITGNIVSKVTNDANDNILLDITTLQSGMYFIKFKSFDGVQYITKIIKE